MQGNFHESLARDTEVRSGSDRAFGRVMATVCCIIAGIGFWVGTPNWPYWTAAAVGFAIAAWQWPAVLAPLNQLWFRFGLALHRVVNPLVMGFLFVVVVTPVGLLMRLSGKRPLGLQFERNMTSYWLIRDESELQPGPMTKQY